MTTFKSLGLDDKWVDSLARYSITEPSEIQEQAIPILLAGKTDFIGLAQTGTGKTAAYGLPAMALCPESKGVTRYLIVSPTRELAMQIAAELERFSQGVKALRVLAVYGGAPITNQLRSIRQQKPHIVVATPGRLLDLLKRKALSIDEVEAVILDEADEMLNMGFKEDVHEILKFTGNQKNIWMFSATMPPAIRNIADTFMTDPQVVTVNAKQKMNENIIHQYCITHRSDRTIALQRFLDFTPDVYGLIFCRTRRDTQQVADELSKNGYRAEALHGDLSQAQRERVMGQFKKKILQLVVATDVAARGIDVEDLTHVFHHGMPQDVESFAHRSGRTARAGKTGISLAIVGNNDKRGLKRIEREMKINFSPVEVPTVESITAQKLESWATDIVETRTNNRSKAELDRVLDQFADLSKEEIIEKLIAQQIKSLRTNSKEIRSNQRESTRDRKESFGEREPRRSRRKSNSDSNRYFINVGHIDGLDKQTLVEFVAEQTDVSKNKIDGITIKDRFSFFDVPKSDSHSIEKKFEGLMVNGRKLRVDLDT